VVRLAGIVATVGLACLTTLAHAHWARPEQVIAALGSTAVREAFDITEVVRHATLERLLLIRVGPRWAAVPASERRAAAERWMTHWREAVPQGIIAILQDGTDRPLVNFDAQGRASLKDAR
jgi:hypothetical protein